MNKFVETLIDEVTTTRTENGAKTYTTSLNACVDLFFKAGALRQNPKAVLPLFEAAYAEDRLTALKLALWTRDIRGGAGERAVFHEIMLWLEQKHTYDAVQIIKVLPEFGYWKELLRLMNTEATTYWVLQMFAAAISQGNGLAAKYAPRKGPIANRIRGIIGVTPGIYRRILANMSKTVEQKMCAKQWDQINYSHVPSVAMGRYAKAFRRNDEARFAEFNTKVEKGEVTINAGALYPYDLIKRNVDLQVANNQWNALPDFVPEGINYLPMIDVSGSMETSCGIPGLEAIDIAISIGMYLMERNKSPFKDLALTFSSEPQWIQSSKSPHLNDRFSHIRHADWGGSTNISAAFNKILLHAKNNHISPSDMPSHLIVLSDMEFDRADRGYNKSNFEAAKESFAEAGYELPMIVFWNIARSGANAIPTRYDDKGAALVSGSSPAVIQGLLGGMKTPIEVMLNTIGNDRYNVIR